MQSQTNRDSGTGRRRSSWTFVLAGLTLVGLASRLASRNPGLYLIALPGSCSWLVVDVAWSEVGRAAFRAEDAPDASLVFGSIFFVADVIFAHFNWPGVGVGSSQTREPFLWGSPNAPGSVRDSACRVRQRSKKQTRLTSTSAR